MIYYNPPTIYNSEDQRMYEAEKVTARSRLSIRVTIIMCSPVVLMLALGVVAYIAHILGISF